MRNKPRIRTAGKRRKTLMKFQNKKNTTGIWFNKFLLTLFFAISLLAIGFIRYFDRPFFGLERVHLIILALTLWLLIASFQNLRKPCYIYFEDQEDRIIIRYYPLRIINQKKNGIEIIKNGFVKFETEKFFWGKHEKLIIYQRYKNGIAKYPPISLSAVNKEDIEKLKGILAKYAPYSNSADRV